MGERYQMHIIATNENGWDYKQENKTEVLSIHAQWMWGYHLVKNLHRLINTLRRSNFGCYSGRFPEFESYVTSILRVNKYLEGGFYPYSIYKKEEPYHTYNGDSNHGWCVLRVHISKKGNVKVETRTYDVDGNEISEEELLKEALDCMINYDYKSAKEDKLKYVVDKITRMCKQCRFNNTEDNLEEIFNEEVDKWNKKKKSKS